MLVVQKVAGVIEAQAQRAGTVGVVHTHQVVRFAQARGLADPSCSLRTLQAAAHEHSTPGAAVW